jgi:hypothetical protein
MEGQRTTHSRYEVVAAGEQAWAWDEDFRRFYFDGRCFWRLDRKHDSLKLVTAWRAPAGGWMHAAGYPCTVCSHYSAEVGVAAREAGAEARSGGINGIAA